MHVKAFVRHKNPARAQTSSFGNCIAVSGPHSKPEGFLLERLLRVGAKDDQSSRAMPCQRKRRELGQGCRDAALQVETYY